jgi:hypothetical protein
MPEEPQFHMTVVTQKRRRRPDPVAEALEQARNSAAARESSDGGRSGDDRGEYTGERHHQHGEHHSEHHHSGGDRSGEHHHSEHRSEHHGEHHHSEHRRRYQDFGSVNLGSMEDGRPAVVEELPEAAPSKGQIQREFYDKYDSVLNRRYATRNKAKANRVLIIVLVVAFVLIVSLIGIGSIGQDAETLEKPQMETNPVVSLDLGGT